jgi:hypothetical protein
MFGVAFGRTRRCHRAQRSLLVAFLAEDMVAADKAVEFAGINVALLTDARRTTLIT